jgi:hypothetical protein
MWAVDAAISIAIVSKMNIMNNIDGPGLILGVESTELGYGRANKILGGQEGGSILRLLHVVVCDAIITKFVSNRSI